MRPTDADVKLEDVNFFDNLSSNDVGDLLFGGKMSGDVELMSLDNTSDGVLQKRWKMMDGKCYIIKGITGKSRQEPINEVIASMITEASVSLI